MKFCEILDGGTHVYTSEKIRFTEDPLLLAGFCRTEPGDRVLDIGTGCGIILLKLCDTGLRGRSAGIDISGEAAVLLSRGLSDSGITWCSSILADARNYRSGGFTLAVCNPPYFRAESSVKSPSGERHAARADAYMTLGDMAACAHDNLVPGGRLCFCIPPEREEDAEKAMESNGLSRSRREEVPGRNGRTRLLLIEAVRKEMQS
ncbi:MAG: tRNA1(Val) (adenine(37)-N6)-methyltransferase [Oscillospiraceae bacterium]|jgi:tRNA1Val (adenine37-N6)-methyltransferase